MIKQEAINKLKAILLKEITKYEESKIKIKSGRPSKLTISELVYAIFLYAH